MRRQEGTPDPSVAALSQMRRRECTHEPNPKARLNRRTGAATEDTEETTRVLFYGTGVSYQKPTPWKSALRRDRRRDRPRYPARRTVGAETWRDECPLEERATAIGVSDKYPRQGRPGDRPRN